MSITVINGETTFTPGAPSTELLGEQLTRIGLAIENHTDNECRFTLDGTPATATHGLRLAPGQVRGSFGLTQFEQGTGNTEYFTGAVNLFMRGSSGGDGAIDFLQVLLD